MKTIQQQHHYGLTDHKVKKGETVKEAMYRAVRESHDFLTDDNHEFEVKKSTVKILRNENSTPYHALCPSWARDETWFCVYFNI